MGPPYANRREAGKLLAAEVLRQRMSADLVLALPRGGVPVAAEVARALGAPLDVFPVRKLGLPSQPEYAIGALAPGAPALLNRDLVDSAQLPASAIDAIIAAQARKLDRQELLYRKGRAPLAVAGRAVLLIDDGLATGFTMRAAIAALRHRGARRVLAAVPVAPPATCDEIAPLADGWVCPFTPEDFLAVGNYYRDFSPTDDREVIETLAVGRKN